MPIEITPALAPMEFHGASFTGGGAGQVRGDCLFCGAADHFYANPETGQWDCKKCARRGNVVTFLEEVWRLHKGQTDAAAYRQLAKDRGLPPSVFRRWGLAFDVANGRWLIPVRTVRGTVQNLRTWRKGSYNGSTKGCALGLYGAHQLPSQKTDAPLYLCEGEWDAMALDYLLRRAQQPGTALAVPGADVFKQGWVEYFTNRDVVLCYDADEAGDRGSARAASIIGAAARSIRYLCWPDDLPTGYDVRDFVMQVRDEQDAKAWKDFTALIQDAHRRKASLPADAAASARKRANRKVTFARTVKRFAEWVKVDSDFRDMLAVACAVVLSNQIPGDPLWMFLVAPPGSGKTLLLQTFAGLPDCVFKSSLTRHTLVSGFQARNDPSLLPQLNNKVFILKDYTEILGLDPGAQQEIYSTLRGAYDGSVEKPYGNGVLRKYDQMHFSMLAGVTSAIHGNTSATLGERFLKFQLLRETVFNAEDQIRSAMSMLGRSTQRDAALRKASEEFLDRDIPAVLPAVPNGIVTRIVALSQLIGVLRAEVARDKYDPGMIQKRPQQEMGTRLAVQLQKLAVSLAIVFRLPKVDDTVYRIVERTAFDTAIGFHLDIVQAVVDCERLAGAATREALMARTGLPSTNLQRHLDDLRLLHVLEGVKSPSREIGFTYTLTEYTRKLWEGARVGIPYLGHQAAVRRRRNWKVDNDQPTVPGT